MSGKNKIIFVVVLGLVLGIITTSLIWISVAYIFNDRNLIFKIPIARLIFVKQQ